MFQEFSGRIARFFPDDIEIQQYYLAESQHKYRSRDNQHLRGDDLDLLDFR